MTWHNDYIGMDVLSGSVLLHGGHQRRDGKHVPHHRAGHAAIRIRAARSGGNEHVRPDFPESRRCTAFSEG